MVRNVLLENLKELCKDALKNMKLPTAVQKGDTEEVWRAPDIYLMRLPDLNSWDKKAPYIIIQFLEGQDIQEEGKQSKSTALIRFVFAVYDKNAEHGALELLEVMNAIRIRLLSQVIVGREFKLITTEGVNSAVYGSESAPYYGGEITCKFNLPPIEREVHFETRKRN